MTALVTVQGLAKRYPLASGRVVAAVDGIDFSIAPGEALGLVGESGCGKSTVARLVLRLIEASAGQVQFDGQDIADLSTRQLRDLRRQMQIVFQNPHAALNPRRTVHASIAEPLVVQGGWAQAAVTARVEHLMAQVGLPEGFQWRFPHELSGGQKQRVCIARALALEPRFLVLDEPTSALDVSVQAQILEMLAELRQRLGLSYLFISHNLAVVRAVCERVAVMYLGRIVEEGPVDVVFANPRHPYTRALLAAVLPPRAAGMPTPAVAGDIADASRLPTGCRFAPRCPLVRPSCQEHDPVLADVTPVHRVACPVVTEPNARSR